MSFDKPDAPDPTATSNAQMGFNQQAATAQNRTNSYDQTNPFGSIKYIADPSSPSGYRIDTGLNVDSQRLLDTQRGTAAQLAQNSAGMYSSPQDITGEATARKLNEWSGKYVQPIFDQQASNLEAQLRNQGLTPGSEAYNNAKNLLARNQGDVTNQYLRENQGQAYTQAVQDYQRPLQTIAGLEQTMPGNPTFAATPTAQIQPANYAGQVQQNYTNQLGAYENDWNNAAKLGTAVVGLAGAPFTGGLSLGLTGASAGMFGSSPRAGGM